MSKLAKDLSKAGTGCMGCGCLLVLLAGGVLLLLMLAGA